MPITTYALVSVTKQADQERGGAKSTYLGRTLYLLNQVAQTSAASSLNPMFSELTVGVGWVSRAQLLEPAVMEAEVVEKGEYASCRLEGG